MAENPPAWHPDPTGKHDHRWWDGQRWTEHVADAGVAAVDPLPAAPPTGGQAAASSGVGAQAADSAAGDHGADAAGAQGATDPGAAGTGPTGAEPTDAGTAPWAGAAGGAAASGPAGQQPAWSSDQPAWGGDRQGSTGSSTQPAWSGQGQQAAWPGSDPGGDAPAWGTAGGWGDAGAEPTPTGDPNRTPGLAITALVLGMLAIPSAIVLIGGLLGIVAIVLGAVASGKAKRGETGGRGIAIGGIITGSIGLVIAVGLFITVFSSIAGDVTACIEETGDPEACQAELERDLMDRFG